MIIKNEHLIAAQHAALDRFLERDETRDAAWHHQARPVQMYFAPLAGAYFSTEGGGAIADVADWGRDRALGKMDAYERGLFSPDTVEDSMKECFQHRALDRLAERRSDFGDEIFWTGRNGHSLVFNRRERTLRELFNPAGLDIPTWVEERWGREVYADEAELLAPSWRPSKYLEAREERAAMEARLAPPQSARATVPVVALDAGFADKITALQQDVFLEIMGERTAEAEAAFFDSWGAFFDAMRAQTAGGLYVAHYVEEGDNGSRRLVIQLEPNGPGVPMKRAEAKP